MKIAFAATFLAFCLLGTHAIGFSHSISHAHLQSQSDIASITSDSLPSLSHNSDACHLFDALTLAGFISTNPIAVITYGGFTQQLSVVEVPSFAQSTFELYQSRAPPTFYP